MLAIAGKMAGPNWLIFFKGTHALDGEKLFLDRKKDNIIKIASKMKVYWAIF